MSNPNESSTEPTQLSTLATSLSSVLHERFGVQPSYSADQVCSACTECNITEAALQGMLAMFVQPLHSEGFLQKIGSSPTVHDLRKFMASQMSLYGLPDNSFDVSKSDLPSSEDVEGIFADSFYCGSVASNGFNGGESIDGDGTDDGCD